MYLRTSSRRNQDGSTVRYVSIAHNERSPGVPSVAKVLLPLGREDRLDVAGLRRLVGSINRSGPRGDPRGGHRADIDDDLGEVYGAVSEPGGSAERYCGGAGQAPCAGGDPVQVSWGIGGSGQRSSLGFSPSDE